MYDSLRNRHKLAHKYVQENLLDQYNNVDLQRHDSIESLRLKPLREGLEYWYVVSLNGFNVKESRGIKDVFKCPDNKVPADVVGSAYFFLQQTPEWPRQKMAAYIHRLLDHYLRIYPELMKEYEVHFRHPIIDFNGKCHRVLRKTYCLEYPEAKGRPLCFASHCFIEPYKADKGPEVACIIVSSKGIDEQNRFHHECNTWYWNEFNQMLGLKYGDCTNDNLKPLFTGKEQEVMALIANNYDNGDISAFLKMSLRTVKTHLGNIKDKIFLNEEKRNRQKLQQWAIKEGFGLHPCLMDLELE